MTERTAAREIGIGLLGLGSVGAGVVRLLDERAAAIEARLGARLVVRKVGVRDAAKARAVDVPASLLTTELEGIVDDPACELIVELIGGEHPALALVERALARGKPVVTGNKLLLALHGDTLAQAADRAGTDLQYEAAVCGGVPILRALGEGLASDQILALHGIVNGTSNYILTTMATEGRAFGDVLRDAQAAGYAEADPALDVDGGDAAHKLAVLLQLCFGVSVPQAQLVIEGIRGLEPVDFRFAERFGYVIKPLAIARLHDDGLEARVHPTLVPRGWMLAAVGGVNNAVYVASRALGNSMYYGRGAGMMPTAVAVVSDLLDVARGVLARAAGARPRRLGAPRTHLPVRDPGLLQSRYYLRFGVHDRPGALGRLCTLLGEHDISIAEVVQEAASAAGAPATVVITTHLAREQHVRKAIAAVERGPVVAQPTRLLRIAE